jgi:hypothetical protein
MTDTPDELPVELMVDLIRAEKTTTADAIELFDKALAIAHQLGVIEGMQRGYDKAAAVLENAARDAKL